MKLLEIFKGFLSKSVTISEVVARTTSLSLSLSVCHKKPMKSESVKLLGSFEIMIS
jgi:hypothetical protein